MMNILKSTAVCMAVLVASAGVTIAQDNLVGAKWKLNVGKSKIAGPTAQSNTLTYEAADGGFRVTSEGLNADGKPFKSVFGPYKLDGKPYPVVGNALYDATSYKMVDDKTTEYVRYKGDKTIQTGKRELSADGKTLTFSTSGMNAQGQQTNDVAVFDKE